MVGGGLVSLLVGNVLIDERLTVAGVPLNPAIYSSLLLLLLLLPTEASDLKLIVVLLVPTIALAVSVLWSYDPYYGLFKYTNLVVTSAISTAFFIVAIRRFGVMELLRALCWMLALLLLASLVYKMRYGMFDRGVNFLFNGPIIFARLMSLGAICALIALSGWKRILLCTLFCLATAWTQSKGPIIGLTITIMLMAWLSAPRQMKLAIPIVGAIVVAAAIGLLIEYRGMFIDSRMLAFIDFIARPESVEYGAGSIGSRVVVFLETVALIREHPFGVGLGGWALAADSTIGLSYPHNFFLEVFSEAGLVLGVIGVIPFLAFFLVRYSPIHVIAIYFLLVQQVSGDLLDARFLLTFSSIAIWYAYQIHYRERHDVRGFVDSELQ